MDSDYALDLTLTPLPTLGDEWTDPKGVIQHKDLCQSHQSHHCTRSMDVLPMHDAPPAPLPPSSVASPPCCHIHFGLDSTHVYDCHNSPTPLAPFLLSPTMIASDDDPPDPGNDVSEGALQDLEGAVPSTDLDFSDSVPEGACHYPLHDQCGLWCDGPAKDHWFSDNWNTNASLMALSTAVSGVNLLLLS